jgi:prophage antirepressor-like protein
METEKMKKLSSLLVLSLLLSLFASLSVLAADETKIETEQGGYVTLTNIVEEIEVIEEDPQSSDTIYVSNGAVELTIVGDDPYYMIFYFKDADIIDGFFTPASIDDEVEVINNSAILSETGYYAGFVSFGEDFSFSNTATFVIHVVNGSDDETESTSTEEVVPAIASAEPTTSGVLVDGEAVPFQAYNINGNNYFKLRDLAMVLDGTESGFEIGWNDKENAISLEVGKAYTAVGGELDIAQETSTEDALLSTSTIFLDGEEVELTAYLINGNNYFKLRDVAAVIDFEVTWDGETNTIGIDSTAGYVVE